MHASELWQDTGPASDKRLLKAALESFAERGYHGTTTREISQRAGMSPAAIYMHYKSKDELLFLIMRITLEEALRRLRESFDAQPDPLDRVFELVKTVVSFNAEWHIAARVANHEVLALTGKRREQIRAIRRQIEDVIGEAIQLGIDAGQLHVEDIRATIFAILSMAIGVSRWFSPDGRLTPDELGVLYARIVLRMLDAHHQTRRRVSVG